MLTANVNKIIVPSFIDGPGSRMVIFFQGCNMRCVYCHNPETQCLCNHCGQCAAECPSGALHSEAGVVSYSAGMCTNCDKCLSVCSHNSSPKYSRITVQELIARVRKAAPYIDGVTLSGGECSLQPEFVLALLTGLKQELGISAILDTNGTMERQIMVELIRLADGFIFDLKAYNPLVHEKLTGLSNKAVLENMDLASQAGLLYEVRTVIVEHFTADATEITAIANHLEKLNSYTRYKLIPFRPLGVKTELQYWPATSKAVYQNMIVAAKTILGERVKCVSLLKI